MGAAFGLFFLLGMLASDLAIDFSSSDQNLPPYYCTLIPQLLSFPACLRVVLPVGLIGVALLRRLLPGNPDRPHAMIACGILGGPGLLTFYKSFTLAMNLCGEDVSPRVVSDVAADIRLKRNLENISGT